MFLVSWTWSYFHDRAFSAADLKSELSAYGPQTARRFIQPFQTVDEDIFVWLVCEQSTVGIPSLNCALEILLLTYLLYVEPAICIFLLYEFRNCSIQHGSHDIGYCCWVTSHSVYSILPLHEVC